jgi:hypothetical protein
VTKSCLCTTDCSLKRFVWCSVISRYDSNGLYTSSCSVNQPIITNRERVSNCLGYIREVSSSSLSQAASHRHWSFTCLSDQANTEAVIWSVSASFVSFIQAPVRSTVLHSGKKYPSCSIWDFHSGDYEERRLLEQRRVGLLRTEVSEELVAFISRAEKNPRAKKVLAVC